MRLLLSVARPAACILSDTLDDTKLMFLALFPLHRALATAPLLRYALIWWLRLAALPRGLASSHWSPVRVL
jgi:hypothetical protein